jgi:heme-degrading monooxygenase HmoA
VYVVRNIFTCKPGRAKDLVAKFKAAAPHLARMDIRNTRILTDTSAGFWTVVVESEVESLDAYFGAVRNREADDAVAKAMAGYMDLVEGGRREILRVE